MHPPIVLNAEGCAKSWSINRLIQMINYIVDTSSTTWWCIESDITINCDSCIIPFMIITLAIVDIYTKGVVVAHIEVIVKVKCTMSTTLRLVLMADIYSINTPFYMSSVSSRQVRYRNCICIWNISLRQWITRIEIHCCKTKNRKIWMNAIVYFTF